MKTFLKRWAWLAAVVALGLGIAAHVTRFQYTTGGPQNAFLWRHNRWTGQSWVSIAGGQWQKL